MQAKRLVIAIDGPAASGKSTTARKVAEKLGYLYVDTGAMYRAVTLEVLRRGVDPDDEKAVGKIVQSITVALKSGNDALQVLLNGVDVARDIRTPEVTRNVSAVSRVRAVREFLVRLQRDTRGARWRSARRERYRYGGFSRRGFEGLHGRRP